MKADKETKAKVIKNLKLGLDTKNHDIKHYLGIMQKAKTVEEIMKAKQEILKLLVELPLGADTCYFCMVGGINMHCPLCQYGKKHGICFNKTSDYIRILNTKKRCQKAIELYYQGEGYPE